MRRSLLRNAIWRRFGNRDTADPCRMCDLAALYVVQIRRTALSASVLSEQLAKSDHEFR